MKAGDCVCLTCLGESICARVLIASADAISIGVEVMEELRTSDGLYAPGAFVPLRHHADDLPDEYRELICGQRITVRPWKKP